MNNLISSFSDVFDVWTTTRAAGLAAYILLFFSMAFGILQGYPTITAKTKATFYTLHESASWYGMLIAILHGFVLLYDNYVGYSIREIFIPFQSSSEPFLNGLGTIALYLMLLLILTSDLRNKINKKVWRAIHYLSIASYGFALYHGIFSGTDTKYLYVQLMYWLTGLTLVALGMFRPSKSKADTRSKSNITNATGKDV
jgi:predicted ferric reductase